MFQNSKANIHNEEGCGWPTAVSDSLAQTTDGKVCQGQRRCLFNPIPTTQPYSLQLS